MNHPIPQASLDSLESAMVSSGAERVHCEVFEWFTPGLYIRQCHIPAGTLLTTMTHKKTHPFVLTMGRAFVTSENEGSVVYEAPHHGVTEAGTRRAILAETALVWTTYHVTDKLTPEEVHADILEDYTNPLLPPGTDAAQYKSPTNLP